MKGVLNSDNRLSFQHLFLLIKGIWFKIIKKNNFSNEWKMILNYQRTNERNSLNIKSLMPKRNGEVCTRGVMVKAMDSGIVVREFVLQSRYYVHFRANTLGKGMNPLILPAMG